MSAFNTAKHLTNVQRYRGYVLYACTALSLTLLLACSNQPTQTLASISAFPLIIAHRGASGYLPEHTLAAYSLAIWQGADFIEPDLVVTRDGVLIARHDNVLNLTTDVAEREKFLAKKTRKTIDGVEVEGWFSEDFSLAEIKQLRAIERIPSIRPDNARFDGQFEIPTLDEIIELAQTLEKFTDRAIGIYPETKHPSYFDSLGLAMEKTLLSTLHLNGYGDGGRAFIQSFEVGNLKKMSTLTRIPLIQLMDISGSPFDQQRLQDGLDYASMSSAQGLRNVASYASGIGVYKPMVITYLSEEGRYGQATQLVQDAKAAGLLVHPYTFRRENSFLPPNLRDESGNEGYGDLEAEVTLFLEAGVDGVFIDHPDVGIRARDKFLAAQKKDSP